ncbi:MAG: YdcF family protein [Rhodospirillales bacterium]|nr:YdcF family protein [Rhodospirillales bacterium]MBO6786876.1 YdcF family protein [Rhodospirillales bacterium]
MFFYLSKVFWFVASPGNAFLIALLSGLFLTSTRFKRMGKSLVWLAVVFALFSTFVPAGSYMIKILEDRFPQPQSLPDRIDGIVVLGGVIDPVGTAERGRPMIGGAVERIIESAALAKTYPNARLVYSGGSASLTRQDVKEADYVADLYVSLGIDRDRLVLEREARNTWENAKYTMEMMAPKTDETWILVTSAFHMPRSVGAFRRVGWEMIPYPVDYQRAKMPSFPSPGDFGVGLNGLGYAVHEWIGLISYWLTGKNSAAFPKPRVSETQ